MILNKDNKHLLREGDKLRFATEEYIIVSVIPTNYGRGLSLTIRSLKTWQTIYCYPSSKCYGAEIIRREERNNA